MAEVSGSIIDQCCTRSSFAREYGGLLDNRSFGGAQVSRTFLKGQTGQQLLLGAYSALSRQVGKGVRSYIALRNVRCNGIDGRARESLQRNLVSGKKLNAFLPMVVVGTGGCGNVFFVDQRDGIHGSAAIQMYKKGAYFANPCYAQTIQHVSVHGETMKN